MCFLSIGSFIGRGHGALMVVSVSGVYDGYDAQKLEYRSRDHRFRQAGAEVDRLRTRRGTIPWAVDREWMALGLDEHSEWR